jgi:hypothetical protein
MAKLVIELPDALHRALRALSVKRGTPLAALVRGWCVAAVAGQDTATAAPDTRKLGRPPAPTPEPFQLVKTASGEWSVTLPDRPITPRERAECARMLLDARRGKRGGA